MKKVFPALIVLFLSTLQLVAQTDWIRTGTGLGVEKIRIAVPDFKPLSSDPQAAGLLKVFNDTLWNDLDNAGIFELVSKSFYPIDVPGQPQEVKFDAWVNPPPNAGMLVFGNLNVTGQNITVQGWLYDVKNTASPQVLGKQYNDQATPEAARVIAHKFANEIIFRLGGGINGIAESKLAYVSNRSGHKEIWLMDYDGANQHQLTHTGSISLSPRISPDGSRVAFSGIAGGNWEIEMFSLDLNRIVSFPRFGGTNLSPAFSGDGTKIAFSSSRSGDPEIYVVDSTGHALKTHYCRQRARRFSDLESEDELPDRLGQRTHGLATDLHDGSRRHQRPAHDGSRLRGIAFVGSERTIPRICLDSPLRTWCSRRAGYLRHGHHYEAVRPVDSRRWTQRLPFVVSGQPSYRFSVQSHRHRSDMDHARRWLQSEATDNIGPEFATELEF